MNDPFAEMEQKEEQYADAIARGEAVRETEITENGQTTTYSTHPEQAQPVPEDQIPDFEGPEAVQPEQAAPVPENHIPDFSDGTQPVPRSQMPDFDEPVMGIPENERQQIEQINQTEGPTPDEIMDARGNDTGVGGHDNGLNTVEMPEAAAPDAAEAAAEQQDPALAGMQQMMSTFATLFSAFYVMDHIGGFFEHLGGGALGGFAEMAQNAQVTNTVQNLGPTLQPNTPAIEQPQMTMNTAIDAPMTPNMGNMA